MIVVTSDLFGAGTDAPVFITVSGPKGQLGLGELALANSSDAFERGQVDEFFLELPAEQDCGAPITKVSQNTLTYKAAHYQHPVLLQRCLH